MSRFSHVHAALYDSKARLGFPCPWIPPVKYSSPEISSRLRMEPNPCMQADLLPSDTTKLITDIVGNYSPELFFSCNTLVSKYYYTSMPGHDINIFLCSRAAFNENNNER